MTIVWAAFARQTKVVDWCKANGCPVGEFARECMAAINEGRLSDDAVMATMLS